MSDAVALSVLAIPLLLSAVAVLSWREPGRNPRRVLLASRLATVASLALACGAGVFVALSGAVTSPLLGVAGIGLSIRLDALSLVMLGLVLFVGAIAVQYSRNYLDGDDRHGAFLGGLCLTLAAVSLLVTAGNLVQLVAGWIATSLALHRLLLFYPERPGALTAARKKFLVARAGDGLLILAAVLLAGAFGTTDIAALLESARGLTEAEALPWAVPFAAGLIALAALLKSAQVPSHGWLTEVMETPTPVSALLHAGIINAGGFLVLRFADLMLLEPVAMLLLTLVGGLTALFGAVCLLAQTSVKVALAYSTIAQMGFMLLQCGLGAFSAAALHIVAHSLYKAHAFLSAGGVIEQMRANPSRVAGSGPGLATVGLGLVLALGLFFVIGQAFGVGPTDKPAIVALGAILILGLTHLLAQALSGKTDAFVLSRALLGAALVSTLYFSLQAGAAALLADSLPPTPLPGPVALAAAALVVAGFAAVTLLQVLVARHPDRPLWRRAYVLAANGFYANSLFNRLVGALRRPSSAHA